MLVIDDFGYRNDSVSDGFLNLPIALTCAVLPGHPQSSSIAKKAIQSGKEVIIHMPMQSSLGAKGEDDYKLKVGMTSDEIEWRLNEALKEIPEAIGINNHQGSKATTDGKVMGVVASVLKQKNKIFLIGRYRIIQQLIMQQSSELRMMIFMEVRLRMVSHTVKAY